MHKWEILSSKYLLRRKWIDVREDRVRLPNGAIIDEFHVLEYPDWVCTIPITTDGTLVMVEQYRHGIGQPCLEFPAGVIDSGEDILAAARRELVEETGHDARRFEYLGRCAPEPSRHSNYAHIVAALDARPSRAPEPDHDEVIHVTTWPLANVRQLVEQDSFVHGVHHAAILLGHLKGYLDL
jgi:8-oxo-dGTP pyrophosphatase MutT (NUDIX family)